MRTTVAAAETTNLVEVERLCRALGARIHGIDCRNVDDTMWSTILTTFHRHHVLVFPGQYLSPSDHVTFMERFGKLDVHPQELSARSTLPLPENPKVELMANTAGSEGPRADVWHTDVTFRPEPVAVTSLYGVETPQACADTIWTSMRAVFEDLSDAMKDTLRGLNAVHATAWVTRQGGKGIESAAAKYDPTAETDSRKKDLRAQYREEVVHPIVHRHEAGYETLYINPAFVNRIEGWTADESKPILEWIYKRATEPIYNYRHRWTKHDLVVWDNRCTMHYGVNDYETEDTRVLHRTTGAPFVVHASR